jgi:hypothetical protein
MAAQRKYPRSTLQDALQVPMALKDKNGGNAWAPGEVAKALGVAKTNNRFFYLTAASRDYGLTVGTRDAAEISLTDHGRATVYPDSANAAHEAKVSAFLNVSVFKDVLSHYSGSKLPELEYLANTLETQFGVPHDHHKEFVAIFEANCRYLGIGASFDLTVSALQGAGAGGGSQASVTIAKPDGQDDGSPVCFVIMPFVERNDEHSPGFFNEVLTQILSPAATAAGFTVKTADRRGSDVIQSTIVNDLLDADLVVADLTEHNPNVLFELGMRIAEEKPVVLVRSKGTGRIFDVDNLLRVVEYDPNVWPTTVAKDIRSVEEHIRAGWAGRETNSTYLSILRSRAELGH